MVALHSANLSTFGSGFLACSPKHAQRGFPPSENAHLASAGRLTCCRRNCIHAQLHSSDSSGSRFDGRAQAPHGLFLHDLMDQAGIDTCHAKAARASFVKEVIKLSGSNCDGHNSVNCTLDLAKAALEVACEDDALVSHSPVPVPVDSYLDRLNSMAMEFANHFLPSHSMSPDSVLSSLSNYIYGYKSFQRTSPNSNGDARDCYFNMVLARRLGHPATLAIIYIELVKILHSWGVVDFVVDMVAPKDKCSLPHPIPRNLSEDALREPASQLLTPKGLLVEVLTVLKNIYWPWKRISGSTAGTNFLNAADAANHGIHLSTTAPVETLFTAPSNIMGSEVASARAAKHRLQRGIWTCTSFGDMRRALAATERLVLLGTDRKELRDYGILLYHCGLFESSLGYLTAYHDRKEESSVLSESMRSREDIALESVMWRLRLIMTERRWDASSASTAVGSSLTDPW